MDTINREKILLLERDVDRVTITIFLGVAVTLTIAGILTEDEIKSLVLNYLAVISWFIFITGTIDYFSSIIKLIKLYKEE